MDKVEDNLFSIRTQDRLINLYIKSYMLPTIQIVQNYYFEQGLQNVEIM